MRSTIVCVSVSHGNTRRVADAIGEVLGAEVVDPEEVSADSLTDRELVGFGSGIFAMSFHPRLREFVRSLPPGRGRAAFVFDTSGAPEPPVPFLSYSRSLRGALEAKGYEVIGTFACRGYDTWLPLRLIGGLNRGHPNEDDLDAARRFARRLVEDLRGPDG